MKRLFNAVLAVGVIVASLTLFAGSAGAGEDQCVPQEAYTEYTEWTTDDKAPGEGWYLYDTREVFDHTEVVTEAQHYSYTGGPVEGNPATTPPGADWQANTHQEPHLNNPNVTWVDGFGVGLHYTSAGSSGNADYFYFQPEVTEDVYRTEYKYAFDHEEVVCEDPDEPYASLVQGDCNTGAYVILTNPTDEAVTFVVNGTSFEVAANDSLKVDVAFGEVIVTVGEDTIFEGTATEPDGCNTTPPPYEEWEPSWTPDPDPNNIPIGEVPTGDLAQTGLGAGAWAGLFGFLTLGLGSLALARKRAL